MENRPDDHQPKKAKKSTFLLKPPGQFPEAYWRKTPSTVYDHVVKAWAGTQWLNAQIKGNHPGHIVRGCPRRRCIVFREGLSRLRALLPDLHVGASCRRARGGLRSLVREGREVQALQACLGVRRHSDGASAAPVLASPQGRAAATLVTVWLVKGKR